jgi:hypothetical protein
MASSSSHEFVRSWLNFSRDAHICDTQPAANVPPIRATLPEPALTIVGHGHYIYYAYLDSVAQEQFKNEPLSEELLIYRLSATSNGFSRGPCKRLESRDSSYRLLFQAIHQID